MRPFGLKLLAMVAVFTPVTASGNVRERPGWTSAPGVFLSDIGTGTPGGVPEPAAWGMMIGGLAFAGGMLRRRKAVAALT